MELQTYNLILQYIYAEERFYNENPNTYQDTRRVTKIEINHTDLLYLVSTERIFIRNKAGNCYSENEFLPEIETEESYDYTEVPFCIVQSEEHISAYFIFRKAISKRNSIQGLLDVSHQELITLDRDLKEYQKLYEKTKNLKIKKLLEECKRNLKQAQEDILQYETTIVTLDDQIKKWKSLRDRFAQITQLNQEIEKRLEQSDEVLTELEQSKTTAEIEINKKKLQMIDEKVKEMTAKKKALERTNKVNNKNNMED